MKIDFYYQYYNDSLEVLVKKLQVNRFTDGINDNIYADNDVWLIHAIYRIITTTKLYRKKDIKEKIWKLIEPQLLNDEEFNRGKEQYKNGFDDLFDFCWKQKFSRYQNGKRKKKLCKIAYKHRRWYRKIYDSNIAIIAFLILFIYWQHIVNNMFWEIEFMHVGIGYLIISTLAVLYCSLLIASFNIYYFPVVALIIMIGFSLYHIFHPPDFPHTWDIGFSSMVVIALAKRDVIIGLSYLLWYPVLLCNKERLEDLYVKLDMAK